MAWSVNTVFKGLSNRMIVLACNERKTVLSNVLQLNVTVFPQEELLSTGNLLMFGNFTPQANTGFFRHARRE